MHILPVAFNYKGLHLGPHPVVIVNDSENVKKVLYHRDFDGRPDILMGRMRHPELDLHGENES